jgi:hypothetical protein
MAAKCARQARSRDVVGGLERVSIDRLPGSREARELCRRAYQPFELADSVGLDLAHALG